MYCRKCGTQLTEGATFCAKCGFLVAGAPPPAKEKMSPVVWVVISIAGLFVGVIFVGILAAIAIPKFTNTKQKAYVASMKSDLRDLATAEEAYYGQHQRYSSDLGAVAFTPSANVTVTVTSASREGWAARTNHLAVAYTCQVGFGADSIAGVGDGVIQCTRDR